jgi:hypothetical protein
METIFITEEKVQLVLVPATELDRLLLSKLTESGVVEMEFIRQPVGVLGRSVKDAVLVRPKSPMYAGKTEDVQRV